MKIIKILLVLFVPSFAFASSHGISFDKNRNWEQVKNQAKLEHKYIFVDAFATWCVPCKQMDKEVYINKQVGDFFNGRFISVKVQMDQTTHDNDYVKSWYGDAKQIMRIGGIKAFPAFLFFNPEGELIYSRDGFKSIEEFINLGKAALSIKKGLAEQLTEFNAGKRGGIDLLNLAKFQRAQKQESSALAIATALKDELMNTNKFSGFYKPENLQLFTAFGRVFNVNDPFIKFIFKNQASSDSSFKAEGFSQRIVDFLVVKDFIDPNIATAKKQGISPSWIDVEKQITLRFDVTTAEKAIAPAKIRWAEEIKDWPTYIQLNIDLIDKGGVDIMQRPMINAFVWNGILLHSIDSKEIDKGLAYMDKLIKTYPTAYTLLDTYGNLLWKSGDKQKAIIIERQALKEVQEAKDQDNIIPIQRSLSRMLDGDAKTWDEN
ncbi:thioredoxin-like protein [Mucilaginibacter gracilis]|uniref:Thioredoxin-like protein n=1 Tax=Mucilaginibacter gracilis TaxID=423350 RepID=A0A495J078_9SPHI|nr:DUF255 domain-containing protein [Mucilaginibacter gracilis]RKR82385.1 thioredoxin-like protein [Mucilaginibacter gracilis]